jgi:hypothetical protein
MMRSTAEELGHVIMCPHCYSPVTVGGELQKRAAAPEEVPLVLEDSGEDEYQLADEEFASQASQRSSATEEPVEEEDEYRLSEAEARPPKPVPAASHDDELDIDLDSFDEGDGEKPQRRERGVVLQDHDPMDGAWVIQERRDRLSLEDRLAEAARMRRFASEPPDHPFLSGVFNFLFYPSSWKRWLGLAAGTALVYFLVANAVDSGISGGAELFFSLIFAAMAAGAALLLVMFAAVAALAIVQDTAAGADEVEGWPDFNFVDWAGQAFYFINAVGVSVAPGFVLASAFESWGPQRWIAPAVTAALFFPIVVLSQLDGMSPFSILTPGVLKGALKSPLSWMAFYAVSLFTLAAATGLGWLTLRLLPWTEAPAAAALGVISTAALMIECRLIGRLAWFCEETKPPVEEETEGEEAVTEEDREVIE